MADTRPDGGARHRSSAPTRASRGRARTRAAATKKRRWLRRSLVGLLIAGLVAIIAGVGGFLVLYATTEMPDPNQDFQTQTSFVYFDDGTTKIGNFAVQNRTLVGYDQMAQSIKDATVAAENRTFWTDPGISIPGMIRATWQILTGGDIQGGSTITQQYIKIMYLNSERTLTRKLKEIVLAAKVGRDVPKEQILAGYLNTVYFGRGAYGVEAAAKAYFNVSASELTLSQSAVLASVLNNPSIFDPSGGDANVARLFDRYRYVLQGMLEMNSITQAEYDDAAKALPTFPDIPTSNRYGGPNGFLLKMVEAELADKGFDESQINGGGLRITTTFKKDLQDAAVESAQKYTTMAAENAKPAQDPNNLHVAIASVDTSNGAVLALYGGADYVTNSRNWATTDRAAASTFKAYALVAGLRNGFTLNSTFNGDTFTPEGDTVPVHNESEENYGPKVSLRKATQESINTAFVDMVSQIDNGPQEVIKAANDAGVPTGAGWDANNRIALGTAEVSPLDNAVGYATFANGGTYNEAHVVAKVTDASGKVLYEANPTSTTKIGSAVASSVTSALRSVVDQGTGTRVRELGYETAGKTGTSGIDNATTSAWFVAYTKQISTAVMYVAGDDGQADLEPYKRPGDSAFFGATYPAMTWLDYMKVAMNGLPHEELADQTSDTVTQTASVTPTPTPTPTPSATPTPTQVSVPVVTPSAVVTSTKPTPVDPTSTTTSAPSSASTALPTQSSAPVSQTTSQAAGSDPPPQAPAAPAVETQSTSPAR